MTTLRDKFNGWWKYVLGALATIMVAGASGWMVLGAYKSRVDSNETRITKIEDIKLPNVQDAISNLHAKDVELEGQIKTNTRDIQDLKSLQNSIEQLRRAIEQNNRLRGGVR